MDPSSDQTQYRLSPVASLVLGLVMLAFSGCIRVKTEPIRVEPIYIEMTINHRLQKALDDIFADIDQASETTEYAPLEKNPSDAKE